MTRLFLILKGHLLEATYSSPKSHFTHPCAPQEEIVRALIKTFKMSEDHARMNAMRDIVGAVWAVFDSDGSGSIEIDEFTAPGDGLADAIIASMQQ